MEGISEGLLGGCLGWFREGSRGVRCFLPFFLKVFGDAFSKLFGVMKIYTKIFSIHILLYFPSFSSGDETKKLKKKKGPMKMNGGEQIRIHPF